jgi:uncharacterized protein YegP (UPF0339 family)
MPFWITKDPHVGLWRWTLETGSGRVIATGGGNYASEDQARADIRKVQETTVLTPVFDKH